MKKIKLNLGCGVRALRDFINVDKFITEKGIKSHKGFFINSIWEKGAKFVQADILKLPFPNDYADYIEMIEVIEHLRFRDVIPAFKEIRRVMKKGAKLLFTCPNFDGLAIDWLQMKCRMGEQFDPVTYVNVMMSIMGNQVGLDEGEIHKSLFNPQWTNFCLVLSGFKGGEILIYSKGTPIVKIGERGEIGKHRGFRNDTLLVTAIK